MTSPAEPTGALIADKLGEKDTLPREQIQRIVARLGAQAALALLDETLAREAQGGLMLPDGSRRRTPGGAYFYIVRRRVSKEDWAFINPASQERPAHPPPNWEDRMAGLADALEETGTVMSVKITLTGRPGRIIERNDYIVTSLKSAKPPPLPKGLPVPPGTPTVYVAFIAKKSWDKVADTLKDPEALLVVGGYPILDQQAKGIAVLAHSVSVKLPPPPKPPEDKGGEAPGKADQARTG